MHGRSPSATTTISIRALRGEGDPVLFATLEMSAEISIRALRGEGDAAQNDRAIVAQEFQSTPSVGRATRPQPRRRFFIGISIHALRGEGDCAESATELAPWISIHALRVEGDPSSPQEPLGQVTFQSTPSVWRATGMLRPGFSGGSHISIHALRVEGDATSSPSLFLASAFQSTPSVWRATPRMSVPTMR